MRKQPRTTKLAFIVENNKIYEREFSFDFYGGFALSQKQKTIESFHKELLRNGINQILEISRKSMNPIGNSLSAFNLKIEINNEYYPIECVYQSSKVFNNKIQFKEAINLTPLEAKKLVKTNVEKMKLNITSFNCFDIVFPTTPTTLFYDYIYVLALFQNNDIGRELIKHNCFTDVEFNHKKQSASQARSCAIYKYLVDNDKLGEYLEDIEKFKGLYYNVIVKNREELMLE